MSPANTILECAAQAYGIPMHWLTKSDYAQVARMLFLYSKTDAKVMADLICKQYKCIANSWVKVA